MLSMHVTFQTTRLTKNASFTHTSSFIASLVRVNTHVDFQTISSSKTLLAHITFVRFLVRVNKLVRFQMIRSTKSLLAQITFVRSFV